MNRVLKLWLMTIAVLADAALPISASGQAMDRRTVVQRHNFRFLEYMPNSPASLGNGEFAFTFDVTGLQTFPRDESGDIPLGTMAQWSWHTFPESKDYKYSDTLREFDVHGRKVSYATDMRSETANAIRSNPHRFNLARIGLRLLREDGTLAEVKDLQEARQTVDLWSGRAESRFELNGQPVTVHTVVHPESAAVACKVESPLLPSGRVAIEIAFAYPAGVWGPRVDDWVSHERHTTGLALDNGHVELFRKLDETEYSVEVVSNGDLVEQETPHCYLLTSRRESLEAVIHFRTADGKRSEQISYESTREAAAEHWENFWSSGGAIDLSRSHDPRWRELERRIVQSQFVTAVNCAGSMPPQETGLVCNSWFGKSHLEMHGWHAIQFALWGRLELLERSLGWYETILPAARSIAERQGYAGVRWPKMTGPQGVSSPSEVGELLIWQQPHPLYFAELVYRQQPNQQTLARFAEIVEQTATFMADYAHFNEASGKYELGPVLIPAQECYDGRSPEGVMNPTYELVYWRWALRTANAWRERRGLERNAHWEEVAEKIALPNVRDGVYTAIANNPFTRRRDHPSMLAALGVLPDVGLIDRETMNRTLTSVRDDWQWEHTWGWDYPMLAMTAARLGRPEEAIDFLLLDTPKNGYLPNGHCRQADRLPVYLPANGGLLAAIALMTAGWDGCETEVPGFPKDGKWDVRHEGLLRMP